MKLYLASCNQLQYSGDRQYTRLNCEYRTLRAIQNWKATMVIVFRASFWSLVLQEILLWWSLMITFECILSIISAHDYRRSMLMRSFVALLYRWCEYNSDLHTGFSKIFAHLNLNTIFVFIDVIRIVHLFVHPSTHASVDVANSVVLWWSNNYLFKKQYLL